MMNFAVSEPVAMQTMKPQRGRPKGSGIDDRARLQQIASLMAVDPRLKPTTAIKAIGITDPSTIRRLRDKLRSMGDDLRTGPLTEATETGAIESRIPMGPHAGHRALASARLKEQIRRADFSTSPPPRLSPFEEQSVQTARAETTDTVGAMAHMLALGLVNMCNLIQHQPDLWQQMMKQPAVALALRQQLILSEMLLDQIPARPTRQAPAPALMTG